MPWRGPQAEGEKPTLGWVVADFIVASVVIPDGEFEGEPFKLSDEQLHFLLGMYELHPNAVADKTKPSGAFVHPRGAQLVAPQKYGKGPLSAAVIIAEAYGPVLFDGWDANGEPVGRPWATPWIQVTAVSEDQTANIWRALLPMIQRGELSADIPDTGETRINLPNGGRIEPVTASARSRLGQRITFSAQDETHDWTKRNGGRKLADTQRRNLAGMGGRFMDTGNAWDPAEDSVAQQTFEQETGVFKQMLHGGPGSIRNKRERMRVLNKLYGGSWWVDTERISAEIENLLKRGEYAQAERFFFNRIVPGEDRAFDVDKWDSLARPGHTVPDGAQITIGVDGARYQDALAVVATEVETGFMWPLGIWTRPENAPDDYEHPMDAVDGAVIDAMERYDVWRIYIDPGSQIANIAPLMEQWQGRWGKRVVGWLMSRPRPTAFMIRNFTSAILAGDITHDGNELLAAHIANARRAQTTVYDEDARVMHTIRKESPGSKNKIDGAAAAALSWEARGDCIADGKQNISGYDLPADKCAACGHLRRHHNPKCRARPMGHCSAFVEPIKETVMAGSV
jgi:hypothetical protein